MRRTVDNSMRYFDANYLLGKEYNDDDDDKDADLAKRSSVDETQPAPVSTEDKSVRSKCDSAAVDDVTNVR